MIPAPVQTRSEAATEASIGAAQTELKYLGVLSEEVRSLEYEFHEQLGRLKEE